jgi:hypothetical protein
MGRENQFEPWASYHSAVTTTLGAR